MEPIYIKIPDERALSWNDLYASRHWSQRSRIAKRKHAMVRCYLDPNDGPLDELVDIYVLATYKKDPIDPDNVAAKVYIDGLKPTLLHDDNMRYVYHVTTRVQLGNENCVEIWLLPARTKNGE